MRLRKDLLVLECEDCGELEIVTHEEFVELFRNDEITTDLEEILSEILDDILDDGEYELEFDEFDEYDECYMCEFDCDDCEF